MSHKNHQKCIHMIEIIGADRVMKLFDHYPDDRTPPKRLVKAMKDEKIIADVSETLSVGKAAKKNGVCWKTANEKWNNRPRNKPKE
jgi:hypothetical protein